MHKAYLRSIWQHLPATYGSHNAFFSCDWLSSCSINTRFLAFSQYGKWGVDLQWETCIAYELLHTLCWMHIADGKAPDSTYLSLIDHIIPFPLRLTLKLHTIQDFGHIPRMAYDMMYYNKRQLLLINCFQAFLPQMYGVDCRCFSHHMQATYGSNNCAIFHYQWLSNCLQNASPSLIYHKYLGWGITRRDVHCLWSVSNLSLEVKGRLEVLLTASISHLWVSVWWHFCPIMTLKLLNKH